VRFELQRRPTIVSAAKPRRGQTKSLIELQPAGDAVDHTEAALPLSMVQLRPTMWEAMLIDQCTKRLLSVINRDFGIKN
jgi:hypothetical protein